tara:strand:- start:1088 stop:1711 length:624 start_codon:yes stop_codon:yes gene_type:complete
MATANNQKLNRNGKGQSKKNYSAVRTGTDKGSISFGHLDKKATVTSGVKLDTPDGRHQFNLEIDGERKGWTSSTSPGNFQVECGSDREEADTTCIINALNGDICITAHNGKIRLQGTDIELVAIGEGEQGKGNITCSATETFTVHETPKIILASTTLTKLSSTGIIDIAANSCLKIYGSIIKGVSDACSVKNDKNGSQRFQKENNQV